MAPGVAWVLNLDADLELARDGPYAPRLGVMAAMRPHVARLAASLLSPGDLLVDDEGTAPRARGLPGRAFCPTPRALRLLRAAGAEPEPHPPVAVLRRVNSRAFASSLGTTLPGASFVTDSSVALAMVATSPPVGKAWRIKHAFGMAGRNQRVVPVGALGGPERAFVSAGVARGGVQIEPEVTIAEEYAMHGFVRADGAPLFGAPVRQRCDARGAWVSTARVGPGEAVARLLEEEAHRVAAALFVAGYFGPFGVDAFTYEAPGGKLALQPRSEINARYSMGFATGFGAPPAPRR